MNIQRISSQRAGGDDKDRQLKEHYTEFPTCGSVARGYWWFNPLTPIGSYAQARTQDFVTGGYPNLERGGSRCSSVTGGVVGVVLWFEVGVVLWLPVSSVTSTGGSQCVHCKLSNSCRELMFSSLLISHRILPLIKKYGNPDGGGHSPMSPFPMGFNHLLKSLEILTGGTFTHVPPPLGTRLPMRPTRIHLWMHPISLCGLHATDTMWHACSNFFTGYHSSQQVRSMFESRAVAIEHAKNIRGPIDCSQQLWNGSRHGRVNVVILRFPDSSVSSLIRTGWCGRASHHQQLAPISMGGQLADGDFSTSGRVKSCKVSPEVWLSTLGQRPTLA